MPLEIGDKEFFERVDRGIRDTWMRQAVRSMQERIRDRRLQAARQLEDWEEWRKLGEEIRTHTLNHLDYYLEQLSENVNRAGGHVFFAETAEEANAYIKEVIQKKKAKKIVKSKSMVTEEIGLNQALEEIGCQVFETDLGEYILQLDHDAPSHIVGPALHKRKEQVREVFARFGYEGSSNPEEMVRFARKQLRQEFLSADVGITGCNFAVAESGSIVLVTNEGNGRLCTTLPKIHIAVMGMERIVPTWEELEVLVSLLCRSATGQKLTSYVTGITGPKGKQDVDGPEEFHLVVLDNGRSDILGTEFQSVLHCIRCGACLNVCPVYRQIGGHAYGSIYQGPIGAVLTPLLGGSDRYKELPYASSLCAACTEVCPVKIPLHELLIRHRRKLVEEEKKSSVGERLAMKGYKMAATSPGLFSMGAKAASWLMKPFVKEERISKGIGPVKPWTEIRDFPAPSKEPFREWFKNRKREGKR